MSALGSVVGAVIVVLIIIVAAYAAWYFLRGKFCGIPWLGWICGPGQAQGAACNQSSDCAGWSASSNIACCQGACVTLDEHGESCAAFCAKNPSACPGGGGCVLGYCNPPTCNPCTNDDAIVPGSGCVSTGGRQRYVSPASRGCPQRHTLEDLRQRDLLLRVTPWKQP
jgi:hypothetical protein